MGTNEASAADCYAWGVNPDTYGLKYESDLAFALFVRASLHDTSSEFKLATKLKEGGKFDDVVMIFNKTKEMWLFQAKHSQSSKCISFDDLFLMESNRNTDFAVFKYMHSCLSIKQNCKFKEFKKQYFGFTNRPLDENDEKLKELMNIDTSAVNAMMKFEKSDKCYVRLDPKQKKITTLLKSFNVELTDENSVKEFFQQFTICANQPSDLRKIVQEDLRLWMRGWIPPDDLAIQQTS